MNDGVVVGAGVVGASVAFHLAERGLNPLVTDRDGLAAGSTTGSGALIRAHYPTSLEADLAWESLTDYFEPRASGSGAAAALPARASPTSWRTRTSRA